MYDPETAARIRSTPILNGLDREKLPDEFSRAFAQIVAERVSLRGDILDQGALANTLSFARRLARTNEALVSSRPDREDRTAAAFVSATAHQLVYQVEAAQRENVPESTLHADSISADVSSLLLFLVGQSSADAAEVASSMTWSGLPKLENEILLTIKNLGLGEIGIISNRPKPTKDLFVVGAGSERATSMLYYRILEGLRALAFQLQGRIIEGMERPKDIFDSVKGFAISQEINLPDLHGRGISISFPGPFHLASLLSAASSALKDSSVIGIDPPGNIDGDQWRNSMKSITNKRPFLWPNHQDAIAQGFLEPGTSAVVGFPTGAGKSTITQLKIISTRLSGKKVVFLAPTNALVDQTISDLDRVIKDAEIERGRDDDLNFSDTVDSLPDILVMTPETCLMRMHLTPNAFSDVGLLIFDECHLIHPKSDRDRRAVDAMLCVLNFSRLAPGGDMVLLSAMLKNTEELKDWLSELTERTTLELSLNWKPTRQLRGCIVYKQNDLNKIEKILKSEKQVPRKTKGVPAEVRKQALARPYGFFSVHQTWASQMRKDYAFLKFLSKKIELGINEKWKLTPNSGELAAEIAAAATMSRIKPLIFSQSIPNAYSIAKKASNSLPAVNIELTEKEIHLWNQAVDELGSAERLYLDIKAGKLNSQASVHHGQLLPDERHLVESLFKRQNALTVLVATPTLGQGMNLPAELVIIADDSRFNAGSNRREVMEAQDLLNAAGRAGRAGQNATGMVVVIPGRVIGLNDAENSIGRRWSNLREVFEQADQCLIIDDPLTALLDKIHDNIDETGDLERYLIARLATTNQDNTKETTKIRSLDISKTFAAFRKRRERNDAWVASRTKSAVEFLGDQTDLSDEASSVRDLSSTLGYPEDILKDLIRSYNDDPVGINPSIIECCGWIFDWFAAHPKAFLRIIQQEDLEYLFGKPIRDCATDASRAAFALPKINLLLTDWLNGETLDEIQNRLRASTREKNNATGARKFVLRIVPNLAHFMSVLSLVEKSNQNTESILAPVLEKLNLCVRLGFSSVEMAALYSLLNDKRTNRREVHRQFTKLEPHLSGTLPGDSWESIRDRVEHAIFLQVLG